MRISNLEIKGFGKFENKKITLASGLNVIYGRNEAGKSTIQAFVKAMLYGLRGGRRLKDGTLPPLKQYQPWNAKMYGGILEYILEDGSEFTVGRNFERNTVNITDAYGKQINAQFSAGREEGIKFAEQHLGLSESCFERTAFIGQMQSAVDPEGKKILAERLLNLRQSGDEEVSYLKAMQALKDAQISYVGSGRTQNRPLNWIESQLDAAVREEEKMLRLHEDSMDLFIELNACKREEEKLKTGLESLKRVQHAYAENVKTDTLKDTHRNLLNCLEQLKELVEERQEFARKQEKLQEKQQSLQSCRQFSTHDIDTMSENFALYRIALQELEATRRKKAQNEEKINGIQHTVQPCELFDREGNTIDRILKEVLHQNEFDFEKAETNETPEKKRGQARTRNLSILGLSATALLITGAFAFRGQISNTGFLFIFAAGFLLFAGTGALLFTALRTMKTSSGEGRTAIINYNAVQKEQEEHRKLLNRWMKENGTGHLQDFIRLKSV